ncbi:MAG: TatD family hydrolase [Candidatus Anaerobiospirillum merdipullorum]|uniref:TatD family hydrolase n=1 Tax=Candidatus Anaerobiospirillum merdipullorum TaxID=2838450 RepID=A0A9E2NRZ6_9GAMM|nr:TatD family hydrolase [Candidatus Anaerobiospirillum merdipullorum]
MMGPVEFNAPLYDMHLHLHAAPTPERYVQAATLQGVTHFACMSATLTELPHLIALKQQFGRQVRLFVGCHPQWAASFSPQDFYQALRSPFIAGIGECGLDKRPTVLAVAPLEVQLKVLKLQLQAAFDFDLPVSIHCVKAHNELLSLLRPYQGKLRFCLHGVNLSTPLLDAYLKLNAYISIGKLALEPHCALLKSIQERYSDAFCKILLESDYAGKLLGPHFYQQVLTSLATTFKLDCNYLHAQLARHSQEFFADGISFLSSTRTQ